MDENRRPNKFLVVIAILAFLMATFPIFVDIYRTVLFDTVPHDDYAPYLQALAGDGGQIPPALYVYRIFSVAVALPFYYILPVFTFSKSPPLDPAYQKACQALAMVSYLSLVFTAVIIYTIARKQYAATRASSIIAALATFFLGGFIAKTGVDPFAILVISILALCLKNPAVFVPLVLISVGINEKIPIIFATLLASRLATAIFQRRKFSLKPQLLCACLAVVVYFTIIFLVKAPGIERQTDSTLFITHLRASLEHSLTCRGFFLNILPVLALVLVVVLAGQGRRTEYFQISDISCLIVLLIFAMLADVVYNIGRIVMYTFPLYLPAVALYLDEALSIKEHIESSS